jgi:hypothetical protein
LTALACLWGSKLNEAKLLLDASVPPDLHVAYAPTLLLPYIVKCLERMRQLAGDPAISECLSAEMVVAGCLTPPRFVFRTCKTDVEVSISPEPLPANTLVILPARRLRACGDGSSAFGSDDSLRYPSIRLIRRLLTRVWIASREIYNPAAQSIVAVVERAAVRPIVVQAAAVAEAMAAPVAFDPAAQPALEPAMVQPIAMQPAAETAPAPHSVVQPTLQSAPPDLSSLTRTLPFGNDLGNQRRGGSERRARKARPRPKHADRTVPGPF